MNNTLLLNDESDTLRAGAALAEALAGNELITLSGDLGAGKTTFSRGLIRSLGHAGPVKSPTFTLVETYTVGDMNLAHFDLYRLADPEELEFIGIRDFLDNATLCLIEWPEKGQPLLPEADLALTLRHEGRRRLLSWQPGTAAGNSLAHALEALQ